MGQTNKQKGEFMSWTPLHICISLPKVLYATVVSLSLLWIDITTEILPRSSDLLAFSKSERGLLNLYEHRLINLMSIILLGSPHWYVPLWSCVNVLISYSPYTSGCLWSSPSLFDGHSRPDLRFEGSYCLGSWGHLRVPLGVKNTHAWGGHSTPSSALVLVMI